MNIIACPLGQPPLFFCFCMVLPLQWKARFLFCTEVLNDPWAARVKTTSRLGLPKLKNEQNQQNRVASSNPSLDCSMKEIIDEKSISSNPTRMDSVLEQTCFAQAVQHGKTTTNEQLWQPPSSDSRTRFADSRTRFAGRGLRMVCGIGGWRSSQHLLRDPGRSVE